MHTVTQYYSKSGMCFSTAEECQAFEKLYDLIEAQAATMTIEIPKDFPHLKNWVPDIVTKVIMTKLQ